MHLKIKFILILLGCILTAALGSLLLSGIGTVANLFIYIKDSYVTIAFWVLTSLCVIAVMYVCCSIFVLQKPLLLPESASKDEVTAYSELFVIRLKKNSFLKGHGFTCETKQEIHDATIALEAEANRLIEETSKRVFVGTATSQNGRLDTLIVFALITHLVYRITKLYAQRPHMRDLCTLYKNVAATAFFAGAVEDIVVEEYTQQIIAPIVATSALGAIPGAQSVASVVTTSILDGSMNALLTMRCGIITRNYVAAHVHPEIDGRKELRRAATKEAAAMFVRTSGDTIATVAQLLVSSASKTVKRSMVKALQAVRSIAPTGRLCAAAGGDEEIPSEAPQDEKREFLERAKGKVADTTVKVVSGVSHTGQKITSVSKKAASNVSSGVSFATKKTSQGISAAANSAGNGISSAASAANSAVSSAATTISSTTSKATSGINSAATTTLGNVKSARRKTATVIKGADTAVKRKIQISSAQLHTAAGKASKKLAQPFSRKKKNNQQTDG